MLNYKEVIRRCHEKGLDMCRMTVYRVGIKNGFLVKGDGRGKFDEDAFNRWLNLVTLSLSEDDIYIKDAVKQYNIPYSYFQYYFNKNNIEIKEHTNGLKYVRKSEVESVVEKYNRYAAKKKGARND